MRIYELLSIAMMLGYGAPGTDIRALEPLQYHKPKTRIPRKKEKQLKKRNKIFYR